MKVSGCRKVYEILRLCTCLKQISVRIAKHFLYQLNTFMLTVTQPFQMRDRHKLATFCMDYYYLCQKLRLYYERSRYIVKGWDFILNGRDVLWQVKIYYERSRLYYEWSRISCWQIKIPGRDFMVKGQDFHDDRSKCCYENRPFHADV